MKPILTPADIDTFANLSTPIVCNAIESFNVRLRNEGYINGSVVSRLPRRKSMIGYAITVQMRTDKPPVKGFSYPDRSDWWDIIASAPSPKIIVIQDTDANVGTGSVAGEVHGAIFRALGCTGIITNGAVRDLDTFDRLGLHIYSGSIVPSHAYAHIVEIGTRVEIGGMAIHNGDLLHGDRDGVIAVPPDIAAGIPQAAEKMLHHRQNIAHLCQSPDFSIDKLRRLVASYNDALNKAD